MEEGRGREGGQVTKNVEEGKGQGASETSWGERGLL